MRRKLFLLLIVYGLWFIDGYSVASERQLLPRADDPFWHDSIPATMRQSYIAYGEQFLGQPWTALPMSVFAEFKTTGNRVNYESLNFAKRRQLAALVMAEIVEGKGRFLRDIIDGIGSFCEETWWGIPAHYGTKIPRYEDQTVDLFNAETASLIAWTAYMLKPQLDLFAPQLYQRIVDEQQRRILIPALTTAYWWKTAGMNWNPWICSNWLTSVLFFETDAQKRQEAINQIQQATRTFIDAYPADGGCDEGPGYWDRAAASMFEVLYMLTASGSPLPDQDNLMGKIRNMAAYTYRTYIGNDYCVDFADAHENKAVQQVNIVYPFGLWIGDPTMRAFAAYLGRQKHVLEQPAALYDKSGNFPTLGRELLFLRHINDFIAETPREPLLRDVWLDNLQIMTARRGNLYVAMKGGTNGESHNHNDVGAFIVYAGSPLSPLLIDPGVGEYTSTTFGPARYTIWTMQSQYHNLPQINGCDQHDGKDYHATVVSHQPGQLTLDIASAYPKEAAVSTWKRTVKAKESGISIVEDYTLSTCHQSTRLMFVTPVQPDVSRPGWVDLGGHGIAYDHHQLSASVEDLSSRLDPILQHLWGQRLYRIVLTVSPGALSRRLSYTIR